MTPARIVTLLLLAAIALVASALAAPPAKPQAPAPSATDKCPVCGMFVAKYPDWVASTRMKNGKVYYFDGPKDMFSHYLDPPRYTPGLRQGEISSMQVKEYYSLKPIDARSAFFVVGSDVFGPMGSELIPFASRKDAEAFMADHKGKRVLRFSEITKELVKSLN